MPAEQFVINADFLTMSPDEFGGDGWAVITDPPYAEAVHKNATSCGTGQGSQIRDAKGNVGVQHRDLGFAHITQADRDHLGAVAARCRWSVIFSDVEGAHLWRDVLPRYIRSVAWCRWSQPQLSGDRPPQGFELIVLGHGKGGGRMVYNGPGNLTHFDEKCLRGADKHKCEKPLDLCARLVEYFTKEGDTVLDPYAGSGAIGLACRELGRNYVGIERDADWAAKANARLLAPMSERDAARMKSYWDRKAIIDEGNIERAATTAKTLARKIGIDHTTPACQTNK